MKRRFLAACITSACFWVVTGVTGCAQTQYYEITDKRTGEVSYSTVLPESDTAAAPEVTASQSLVGRRRGVSEHYIVREITRSEYQQRRDAATGSTAEPE